MDGPTGVLKAMDDSIPTDVQNNETITAQIVTDLNVLKIRIALRAGKIIKADINNDPTKLMAKTIMTAIIMAIIKL